MTSRHPSPKLVFPGLVGAVLVLPVLAGSFGGRFGGPARVAPVRIAGVPRAYEQDIDWEAVWADCELLLDARDREAGEAADAEAGALEARLREIALAGEEELVESPEEALLRTFLAQRAGRDAELPPWPDESERGAWPWSPSASWIAALVLPPGPRRELALSVALEPLTAGAAGGPPGRLSGRHLELAWEVWRDAALALRLDTALALGRVVHSDQRADWSAISLALAATRAGLYDEAESVLRAQLELAAAGGFDRSGLANQLGIVLLGRGHERRARSWLGAAILWGSVDAQSTVARLDLAAGHSAAARAGFRRALTQTEPGPWARRGWGLSLLPGRPTADPSDLRLQRGY